MNSPYPLHVVFSISFSWGTQITFDWYGVGTDCQVTECQMDRVPCYRVPSDRVLSGQVPKKLFHKNARPSSDSEAATMYKLKRQSLNMQTGQRFANQEPVYLADLSS